MASLSTRSRDGVAMNRHDLLIVFASIGLITVGVCLGMALCLWIYGK